MEEQRFIEGIKDAYFEIGSMFSEGIREFLSEERIDIIEGLIPILSVLPINDTHSQFVGGVINGDDPIFYTIEYMNEDGEPPLLVNIMKARSDDYLDLILQNNTIKYYEKSKRDRP
jgi:hypothetical protein